MSWVKEFKEFAIKGNAIDMAIGIIIGAAFSKLISSLVNDIIMPPIGMLLGAVDFTNLFINLGKIPYPNLTSAQEAGAPTINYGQFLQTGIDFFIVTASLFVVVKAINTLRRKKEKEAAEVAEEIALLRDIRDSLKKR